MTEPAGPCGIVLAAGLSTRLGRNKLLLPMGTRPIIAWTVENALSAPLEEVIVVTGHEREALEAALRHLPVRFVQDRGTLDEDPAATEAAPSVGRSLRLVHNPDYAQGQSTSLKAGVLAASPACECYVFFLGDQPLVGAEVVRALLNRFRRDHPLLAVPVFEERRGNPVLASGKLRAELLTLSGDAGARSLFESHADALAAVEVMTPAIWMDVDREEDYEACLKVFQTGPLPPTP